MASLICTATYEELAALFPKRALPASMQEMHRLSHINALFPAKEDLYVNVTGIGPINAALSLGLALSQFARAGIPLQRIFILGLAGAYNLDRVPLLSFVSVREEIYPEYGLHDGHEVIANAFKYPQWQNSPQGPLYDRIRLNGIRDLDILGVKNQQDFQECASLTVAGVSASFARAQMLWDTYHADLENMEGFSIAYAALHANIPCTEIRCISNKIGPRRQDEKDFSGALHKLGELLPTLNLM